MKILYCILDDRFVGPHRRSGSIARALREHGIETLFLLAEKGGGESPLPDFECFRMRHMQCFTREATLRRFVLFLLFLPANLLRIRRILAAERVDVVHVDGVTNLLPALAAGLTRRPVVLHYNDFVANAVVRLLAAPVEAVADRIVFQGEAVRRRCVAGRPALAEKSVIAPSGVDTRRFRPEAVGEGARERIREELGIPAAAVLIGTIANLNPLKGHEHFLEAARAIREELPEARFLVVGRRLATAADYGSRLERRVAELGLGDALSFAGFRGDVPEILAALDVFVLASVVESLPNVVLEAMAMGVPVVATDVGSVADLVVPGRTGMLAPPGDASALAAGVLAWLRLPRPEAEEMRRAARRRIEEHFSLEDAAARQEEIYRELVRAPEAP